ncbi:MAG TPA: hypothetical protein VLJ86_20140 [Ramlibacter sp.]|nr:hypothetical protein [Ramlibacter sp.]
MAEPASATMAAGAAALSAVTLALFGVDYYSLLYALVGALMALGRAEQMGRARAIVYVLLSTLSGAVIGNVVTDYFQLRSRIVLIALCLVGGLVAQAVASVIFRAAPGLTNTAVRALEAFLSRWSRP